MILLYIFYSNLLLLPAPLTTNFTVVYQLHQRVHHQFLGVTSGHMLQVTFNGSTASRGALHLQLALLPKLHRQVAALGKCAQGGIVRATLFMKLMKVQKLRHDVQAPLIL